MLRAPRHAGLAARLAEGLGRLLRAGAAQQGTRRQGAPLRIIVNAVWGHAQMPASD